jgi:hypothetical protein
MKNLDWNFRQLYELQPSVVYSDFASLCYILSSSSCLFFCPNNKFHSNFIKLLEVSLFHLLNSTSFPSYFNISSRQNGRIVPEPLFRLVPSYTNTFNLQISTFCPKNLCFLLFLFFFHACNESQNKERLIPYASLNNLFALPRRYMLLRSKIWF